MNMEQHYIDYIIVHGGFHRYTLEPMIEHCRSLYPKLAYHNLEHALSVTQMSLVEYRHFLKKTGKPIDNVRLRTVTAAALFHDIVYDVPAKYPGANEDLSFEKLRETYYINSLEIDLDLAETIIKATKHDKMDNSLPIEAKFVCDADLYNLTAYEDKYRANTLKIMTEFEKAPGFSVTSFLNGRKEWLDKMLWREDIFYMFDRTAHNSAFTNLSSELETIEEFLDH